MHSLFKTTGKKIVAIILSVSISFTSFSQESKFGLSINSLTTNFNYGKANSDLHSYKKNYKGFQAGISYQAGITPAFSIVPELYFAIKGGRLKANNAVTTNQSLVRVHTLEMPVLARLHYKNLYLNAGPYVAYAVGGRIKVNGTGTTPATSTKISFGTAITDFNRWDAGLQAGAGYNFNMKKNILTLDLRYGYGLANISRNTERYNRMLNISLNFSKPGIKSHAN